jgi:hypothetical protein
MMNGSQWQLTCMGKNFWNKNCGQQVGLAIQVTAQITGSVAALIGGAAEMVEDLPFSLCNVSCLPGAQLTQSVTILIAAGAVCVCGLGKLIEYGFTPKEEEQRLIEDHGDREISMA